MTASEENRQLARHMVSVFEGRPSVRKYNHDQLRDLSIDILRCDDSPCRGVTSYCTLGLSDYPLLRDGVEFESRVELVMSAATIFDLAPNTLASAAFAIARTGTFCYPGRVMKGCVGEYYPDSPVSDIYFALPFLWKDGLREKVFGAKRINWLLLVPISDSECKLLLEKGADSLEDVFTQKQIDVFDMNRPPVA